jgi:hypothetical protein
MAGKKPRKLLAQNSAKSSATPSKKSVRGNPEKIREFQFKPGQSGNPGGRPKKTPVTDAYGQWLNQPSDSHPDLTWAQLIALQQVKKACDGDTNAAKEITDRVEGKAKQSIEVKDVTDEFSGKSTAELEFYAANGQWPTELPN